MSGEWDLKHYQSNRSLESLQCQYEQPGHFGVVRLQVQSSDRRWDCAALLNLPLSCAYDLSHPSDVYTRAGTRVRHVCTEECTALEALVTERYSFPPLAPTMLVFGLACCAAILYPVARRSRMTSNSVRPDSDVTLLVIRRIKFQDRNCCAQMLRVWSNHAVLCACCAACGRRQSACGAAITALFELFTELCLLLTASGLILAVADYRTSGPLMFGIACLASAICTCGVDLAFKGVASLPNDMAMPSNLLWCRAHDFKLHRQLDSDRPSTTESTAWSEQGHEAKLKKYRAFSVRPIFGVVLVCALAGALAYFARISPGWDGSLQQRWLQRSAGALVAKWAAVDPTIVLCQLASWRIKHNRHVEYEIEGELSQSNNGAKTDNPRLSSKKVRAPNLSDPLLVFLQDIKLGSYVKYFKAVGAQEPMDLVDISASDLALFGLSDEQKTKFRLAVAAVAARGNGASYRSQGSVLSWLGADSDEDTDLRSRSRFDLLSASIGVRTPSNVFSSASFAAAALDYKAAAGFDLDSQSWKERKQLKDRITNAIGGDATAAAGAKMLSSRSRRWSVDGSFRDASVTSASYRDRRDQRKDGSKPAAAPTGLSIRGVLAALGMKQTRRWSIDASFKKRKPSNNDSSESFAVGSQQSFMVSRKAGVSPSASKKMQGVSFKTKDSEAPERNLLQRRFGRSRRSSHDGSFRERSSSGISSSSSKKFLSFKVEGEEPVPERNLKQRGRIRRSSHDGSFRERRGKKGSSSPASQKVLSFKTKDGEMLSGTTLLPKSAIPAASSQKVLSFKTADGESVPEKSLKRQQKTRRHRSRRSSHDGSFREDRQPVPALSAIDSQDSFAISGLKSALTTKPSSSSKSLLASNVSFKTTGNGGAMPERKPVQSAIRAGRKSRHRERRNSHDGSFKERSQAASNASFKIGSGGGIALASSQQGVSFKVPNGEVQPTLANTLRKPRKRKSRNRERRNSHDGSFKERQERPKEVSKDVSSEIADVFLDPQRPQPAPTTPNKELRDRNRKQRARRSSHDGSFRDRKSAAQAQANHRSGGNIGPQPNVRSKFAALHALRSEIATEEHKKVTGGSGQPTTKSAFAAPTRPLRSILRPSSDDRFEGAD